MCRIHRPAPGGAAAVLFESNYLYAGAAIFVLAEAALVVAALLTPPPSQSQVHGLCVRRPCARLLRGIAGIVSRTAEPAVSQIDVSCHVEMGGVARADADGATTSAAGAANRESRAERKGKAPMLAPSSASPGREFNRGADALSDDGDGAACDGGARRLNAGLACVLVALMATLWAAWM